MRGGGCNAGAGAGAWRGHQAGYGPASRGRGRAGADRQGQPGPGRSQRAGCDDLPASSSAAPAGASTPPTEAAETQEVRNFVDAVIRNKCDVRAACTPDTLCHCSTNRAGRPWSGRGGGSRTRGRVAPRRCGFLALKRPLNFRQAARELDRARAAGPTHRRPRQPLEVITSATGAPEPSELLEVRT